MEALTVVQKKSKAEAEKIALELLDKVGMSERKDFYPSKLSGGQQQRVGRCVEETDPHPLKRVGMRCG